MKNPSNKGAAMADNTAQKTKAPRGPVADPKVYVIAPREILSQIAGVVRNPRAVMDLLNENAEYGSRQFSFPREQRTRRTKA